MPGPQAQSIKAELLVRNKPYAITISPEIQFGVYDKKLRSFTYKDQHKTFMKYVELHLDACENVELNLMYEISPTGRQHYHGEMTIENLTGYLTKDIKILMSFGAVCIKEINDYNLWMGYCTKQEHLWGTKYNIIHRGIKAREARKARRLEEIKDEGYERLNLIDPSDPEQ